MIGDSTLQEQIAYYRARAPEYDAWFFRTGRYDRGPEHRARWRAEVREVERALHAELRGGRVLELACGTGLWTRHLARSHDRVVAVDASPEVIEINRARTRSERVEYLRRDLFSWTPPKERFDAVFFGFWLSHVPEERFEGFWSLIGSVLEPAGRVFWVDSLPDPEAAARDQAAPHRCGRARRRLDDGREFEIVKVFYEPAELSERLSGIGFEGWVRSSGRFFHYGCVSPAGVSSGPPAGSPRDRHE